MPIRGPDWAPIDTMTACRCAVMAVEHNIKPALLLADQYRRELAALPHEVGEAFYFVRLH